MSQAGGGLAGRVVVVTGATGSAGTATTRALQAAGATVVAVGQSAERLSALAGTGVFTEVADLSDQPAAGRLADRVRDRHGAVDGVIQLIGGYRGGAGFASNTDEDWRFLSAALIDTLRHVTLAFHDDLARSPAGRAVIVSAAAAASPTAGSANYAAAKAAAEAWMLALGDSLHRAQSGRKEHPLPQTSAATILVIKALVDDRMRAESPERKFPGFTHVDDLAARIVGLWSTDAAELNGARIRLDG
jgi:NADP-dependent 3-hydroxy acid dehydrogenase YdfG